jgi:ribosomal protein S18 acetylase RimI-like enzyme
MGLLSRWRGPRAVDGVRWRSLRVDDRDAVVDLVEQGFSADGAVQTANGGEFYVGMFGERRLGGFAGEQLVAAVSLPTRLEPTVEGHVHPSFRGRGLGGAVLDWALARVPSNAVVKATVLTGEKQRLFESRGLHLTAALDRLWRPLGEPVEVAPPPPGITIAEWDDEDGFDVYCEAFAGLPSNPFADAEWPGRSFEDWIQWTIYSEFDASVSALARDEQGAPVGFVACWEGGPLQAGTIPAWRRRGVGRALLTAAMARVVTRPDHDEPAQIDVNADNVAAVQLFRRCGFHPDFREAYFTAQR